MKNIITANGTMAEICEKLRIMAEIFPKGATLSDVETVKRFANLTTGARLQADEIRKRDN